MPIYKITNRVTGDIYVGKTVKSLAERFYYHCYDSKKSNTHLHRAMRKHGKENFTIELLEECEVVKLNELEVKWIALLKPRYNMTAGGEGGDTSSSENWKKWLARRPSVAGSANPMFGKSAMKGRTHSVETKAKMAERRRDFWNNMSDEERRRRSASKSGSLNHSSKSIEYDGVAYESLAAAARATGLSEYKLKKRGILHG